MKELSIVIPVYNSENSIKKLIEKLSVDLKEIDFEVILVNDGSKDNSEQVCIELSKCYNNLTFVSLRRNFGEFSAVMCGLNHASGKYAVMIDDDFQNPPSEIIKLLEKAKQGDFDVVYSQYAQKKHSPFRNFGSWLVNKLNDYLIGKPKDLYLSSFKLINLETVAEIIKYQGPYPYIDALIFRVTDNVGKVYVEHLDRKEGRSGYTIKKLVSLFLNVLFGYSQLPIRILWTIGLGLILCWFALFAILLITSKLDTQMIMWLALMLLVSFQFFFIGILGEYIGKAFLQQGGKPQYVIKKVYKAS
ncbi:MAG: glycosyltransferase family 2 protein [Spirosomataceae bacterium]